LSDQVCPVCCLDREEKAPSFSQKHFSSFFCPNHYKKLWWRRRNDLSDFRRKSLCPHFLTQPLHVASRRRYKTEHQSTHCCVDTKKDSMFSSRFRRFWLIKSHKVVLIHCVSYIIVKTTTILHSAFHHVWDISKKLFSS
jgi:hypothetical protein